MEILSSLNDVKILNRTAVALGNFDGVHIGHREIIKDAAEIAKSKGLLALCLTFSNHPLDLVNDGSAGRFVRYIDDEKTKLKKIEELGIDFIVDIPFDEELMTMTPEAFITDILKEKLHAEYVVCGFNYRFGHKAAGDPQLLKEFGAGLGINTVVHDEVKLDGETVSSTAVRKMIEDGDMEKAARFLGRPYSVSGKVVGGRKIGRKIGFPTVNLPVPMQLVTPPNGVYFTMVYCNGREYPGVTDIGVKPTVRKGGTKKFVETHILDFDGKLYGNEIRVDFLKMRRPEVKFSDIEALKRQIKEDRNAAAEFHKNGK